MSSHTDHPQPKTAPKRRWLRRFFIGLLLVFVLIAVFHRWIFFSTVAFIVQRIEKSTAWQIDYQLNGNIFTALELSQVRIRTPKDSPLRSATLGRAALQYHPWQAIRGNIPDSIESIEIADLNLELFSPDSPQEKKPPRRSEKPTKFALPFPEKIDLRGINVKIISPNDELRIAQAELSLLPGKEGRLAVGELHIPGFRTFTDLQGKTTYNRRDLILTDLALAKNLHIEKLQIDASQLGNQTLTVALLSQAFGGNLQADISVSNLGRTNDFLLTLDTNSIDPRQAAGFASPGLSITGVLSKADFRLEGQIDDLSTWNGGANIEIERPGFDTFLLDSLVLKTSIQLGRFDILDTLLRKDDQKLSLSGVVRFPPKKKTSSLPEADLTFAANLPDLTKIDARLAGSALLNGTLLIQNNIVTTNLNSTLQKIGYEQILLETATLAASLEKKISTDSNDTPAPWWNDSKFQAEILTGPLRVSKWQIDKVHSVIRSKNESVRMESLQLARTTNSVAAEGTLTLLEKPVGPLPGALDLTLKINSPVLRDWQTDPTATELNGALLGMGTITWKDTHPVIALSAEASSLLFQNVALGELNLIANGADGHYRLTHFLLDMPGDGFVQATGHFDSSEPRKYASQMSARINDLARYRPLLGSANAETPLAGTVQLDWNGTGSITSRQHEGRLALDIREGIYAAVKNIFVSTSGYYSPREASFPALKISTSKGDFSTAINYAANLLKFENLQLTQSGETRLTGNLSVPFNFEELTDVEKLFPLDEPLAINLTGRQVSLGGLLTDLGIEPPVTGRLTMDAQGKGTLRNLDALIALTLENVEIPQVKELQPLTAKLDLAIGNQRASLTGTIREPSLQPITLSGSLPLDLAALISSGKIPQNLPVAATVILPPSNLDVLTRYLRPLRDVQGNLGINVSLEGTLDKPRFLGSLQAQVPLLRFRNNSLPTIRDSTINLTFKENILNFTDFRTSIAGGPMTARGTINLKDLSAPVLDLALDGKSILFVRNDSLIVRSDLALQVRGPLAEAEVSGTVGITDSRFFREIDILPINLPGRPAPAVEDKRSSLGTTAPPFRDWKFNIAINTLDSFRITGNLANGEIIVKLKLEGTGLFPTLDGNVQIFSLLASLPFSRLKIDYGNIYFGRELPPLNPILDLRGVANVRDYKIDAYIWGDLVKPQSLFLSQPPLSQEDILTLLATGVTQSEIAENPQILAGRAGWLFVQKYFNKVFRRNPNAVVSQDSLADRLDVQIGNVDPKTGRESASVRLRLSDRWQIIGDLDLTGGARGQVRYLIRFQ